MFDVAAGLINKKKFHLFFIVSRVPYINADLVSYDYYRTDSIYAKHIL